MSKTENLYQTKVLLHARNPFYFFKMEKAQYTNFSDNISCGDYIEVYVNLDEKKQIISQVSFHGDGCAVMKASASIMMEMILHKDINYIEHITSKVIAILNNQEDPRDLNCSNLQFFHDIKSYKSRSLCAILPWQNLSELINRILLED